MEHACFHPKPISVENLISLVCVSWAIWLTSAEPMNRKILYHIKNTRIYDVNESRGSLNDKQFLVKTDNLTKILNACEVEWFSCMYTRDALLLFNQNDNKCVSSFGLSTCWCIYLNAAVGAATINLAANFAAGNRFSPNIHKCVNRIDTLTQTPRARHRLRAPQRCERE